MIIFTLLSAVARVSGGAYEPIFEQYELWKNNGQNALSSKQEEVFAQKYLSPLLLCGAAKTSKPRWLIKTLSNDQTSFTGFTSLIKLTEDKFGYDGNFSLRPTATFIEPFAINDQNRQELQVLRDKIKGENSLGYQKINSLLASAENLSNVSENRTKGKSPVFFYSFSDMPLNIPKELYQKLVYLTDKIVKRLCQVSGKLERTNDLESSINNPDENFERQLFTGSVDWMIVNNTPYLIDIGSPAIGYYNDIFYGNLSSKTNVPVGFDSLKELSTNNITLISAEKDKELGFFQEERKKVIEGLKEQGVNVTEINNEFYEAIINNISLPTKSYDYVTRNQDIRRRVLESIENLGFSLPKQEWLESDYENARRFTLKYNPKEGIFVKKRIRERDYYKPLVCPIWSKEASSKTGPVLYEEFVPSLIDCSVDGISGKRSFEIRLYYAGGRT